MLKRFASVLFRFCLWLLIIIILDSLLNEGMDLSIIIAISFVVGNVYQIIENQIFFRGK